MGPSLVEPRQKCSAILGLSNDALIVSLLAIKQNLEFGQSDIEKGGTLFERYPKAFAYYSLQLSKARQ